MGTDAPPVAHLEREISISGCGAETLMDAIGAQRAYATAIAPWPWSEGGPVQGSVFVPPRVLTPILTGLFRWSKAGEPPWGILRFTGRNHRMESATDIPVDITPISNFSENLLIYFFILTTDL